MIGSTGRRWKFTRIAGAGLVCLGAGSLIISGCSSTTAVSDSRASAKSGQQVAGNRSKSAGRTTVSGKRTAQQVAASSPPGRVRISDLEGDTRVQMAARVGHTPTPGNAQPVKPAPDPTAVQAAVLARNAPPPVITPSPDRQLVARNTTTPKSVQKRPAPAGSTRSPATNALATRTRNQTGTIRQTAGADQAPAVASTRAATKPADGRPVITPRKSEWQPENGGDTAASIHERKRADRLMQRAYAMYESGYREEALRLASVAAELENSQLAVYKRGEERPSDFVEFLLVASSRNSAATIETAPPAPGADRTASASRRKTAGNLLSAYGTSYPQAARDLNPTAACAPRFTRDDGTAPSAAANPGQVDVPVAKSCRNPDASVVTAEGNGASSGEAATAGDSRTVVTADRGDEPETAPPVPKETEVASAPALPVAEESEPLAEMESPPAAATSSTSQVTIASVVGLLTGIAGMFGLAWWRRQERQHYAGGK